MKSFLWGLLGAFVLAMGFLFVGSQYSDYRAASEASSWLVQVRQIQDEIERNAVSKNSLAVAGKSVDDKILREMNLDFYEVMDSGVIVLRGRREGQLIVLIPAFENGKMEWRCVGGSLGDIPEKCKGRKA